MMILSRTNTARSHRTGFTLLEMTIVMGALGVATALGVALIITANKTAKMGNTISERLTRRAELARQFRTDVSHAEATPEQFGDAHAGPTCLILTMPGGSTVVYRRETESVNRIEHTGKKESIRQLLLDRPDTKTEFVRPTGEQRVVTLRVTEAKEGSLARTSELLATLGGDLR